MVERKRGLGRGLGALIPSAPVEQSASEPTDPSTRSGGASSASAQGGASAATSSRAEHGGAAVTSPAAAPDHTGTEKPQRSSSKTPASASSRSKAKSQSADAVTAEKATAEGDAPATQQKSNGSGKSSKKKEKTAKASAEAAAVTQEETKPAEDAVRDAPEGPSTSETTSVSRGTAGRRRAISASARQSAMKSRLDMGAALQNRGGNNRPSDMFFTPTPASADTADSPDEAADHLESAEEPTSVEQQAPLETASATAEALAPASANDLNSDVSRGTSPLDAAGSGTSFVEASGTAEAAPSKTTETGSDHEPDNRDLDVSDLASVPGAAFAEVPVDSIHPNRKQPRQVFDEDELAELAYSIGELGVLQPIVVRPSREADGPPYELVMGERRWRATQRAGLDTVPAIVRDTADDDLLRDALLENLHRSQLNPLEEAAAYQQLLEEFGATQEELSRRIGRSRPQISNTLRLMRLPPLVQRRVAAGVLSAGHARALLALEDPAEMERLAQRIVAEGMSVRAAEEAASLSKRGKPGRRPAARAQERHRERLDYIADAFSDKLDTSVKINLGARKGRMTIEFASVEDLNRIISVLDPQAQQSDESN